MKPEYYKRKEILERNGFFIESETPFVSSVCNSQFPNLGRLYCTGDMFLEIKDDIYATRLQARLRNLFCNDVIDDNLDGNKRWIFI